MNNIHLLTCTHVPENSIRKKEVLETLEHNHKYFKTIDVIYQNDKMTYATLLESANHKYKNTICVIANSDILFDETIYLCEEFLEDNMIMSLTRYNNHNIEEQGIFHGIDFYSYSQDAWIFKAGTLAEFKADFMLGTPKCENRFLLEAIMNGVKIVNPSIDIKIHHNHKSNIRRWQEKDAYTGSLCFPKVTTLKKSNLTDCLVKHDHTDFLWKKDNDYSRKIDIDEYIRYNPAIDTSYVDTDFYLTSYNLSEYYQPYCKNKGISNEIIASYHYNLYGYNKLYSSFTERLYREFGIKVETEFLEVSIDKFLPPSKEYKDIYHQKILKGREQAKNSKIAVVGLARNCENRLMNSIEKINEIQCQKLSMFIFENDSEDGTRDILKSASERYDNLTIRTISNNREHLSDRSGSRTFALAEYRNLCLDWVEDNCKDYDFTIVLDLDADLGFSVEGMYNSIGWIDNLDNVGGIASYSLLFNRDRWVFAHYDSFATRMADWLPAEEKDVNNMWFRNWHPPVGSNPIHLYSCFGGLAIYKTEAFLSGRYSGELGSEHVQFHKDLHDNGYKIYLNPSSRFFSVYEKKDFV